MSMYMYIIAFLQVLVYYGMCFATSLPAIFVAFVLPISQKWADQLDMDREEIFLDLFPWKVFLFLLPTFFGKPWYLFDFFDNGVHLISLTFRIFVMVWQLVLVLYVGYRPAVLASQQETQFRSVISTQEVNRKNERVIGHLPLQKVSYPSGSELVTGVTQDFFPLKRCPLNSGPDARVYKKAIKSHRRISEIQ